MKMFSDRHTTGIIYYYKAFSINESGNTSKADFEEFIGAMADTRYRKVIRYAFRSKEKRRICEKFLVAAANATNRKARPGERITQFEIQKWRWDFRSNPLDPKYGEQVESFIFDIKKQGENKE